MQRQTALQHWVRLTLNDPNLVLTPLAGDASFRRYFRLTHNQRSLIAMDAPPEKENCAPFVAVANAFAALGVQVPAIIASDLAQGFLLLSDLGDRLYADELNADSADNLYRQALQSLCLIQRCKTVPDWQLPQFDTELIDREWHLFQHWVLEHHYQLALSPSDKTLLANTHTRLQHAMRAQPIVCVHRDYHSRNLLVLDNAQVGVLDFQDAVWGPVTYDAVSLLRDCYKIWPQEKIAQWVGEFYQLLVDEKQLHQVSYAQFLYWFDLQGIQRNLKAIGIFARLQHLYGRSNYLCHIPAGLNYVLDVASRYPELQPFCQFLNTHIAIQHGDLVR